MILFYLIMELLYFYPQCSFKVLKQALEAFETAGYDTDALRLGIAWDEFLKEIPDHSTVVVYSVDFFPSLMELLSTLATLQERGITLRSLQEPWLNQEVGSTTDFLLKLKELALTLHQNRTQQGLARAAAQGRHAGRPRKRT